jgi:hypothetical protein
VTVGASWSPGDRHTCRDGERVPSVRRCDFLTLGLLTLGFVDNLEYRLRLNGRRVWQYMKSLKCIVAIMQGTCLFSVPIFGPFMVHQIRIRGYAAKNVTSRVTY